MRPVDTQGNDACTALRGAGRNIPLGQVAPREVLVARGRLSAATLRAITTAAVPVEVTTVNPGLEFPEVEDVARPAEEAHQAWLSLPRGCSASCATRMWAVRLAVPEK